MSKPNILDDCKSLTEKLEVFKRAASKLNKYKDLHDLKKLGLILTILAQSGTDYSLNEQKSHLCTILLNYNVINITANISIDIYYNLQNFIDNSKLLYIFDHCFDILINYCESSKEFCKTVSQSPIIELVRDFVINQNYQDKLCYFFSNHFRKTYSMKLLDRNDRFYIGYSRLYIIFTSCCCLIHNLAIYIDFKEIFASNDIYKSIVRIITSTQFHTLLIMSYSTLAVIIDDNNTNLLKVGEFSIDYFINVAYFELNKDPSVTTSFRLWEILNVLYSSIRNNDIANTFILKNGVLLLLDILSTSTISELEEKYAGLCLKRLIDEPIIFKVICSRPNFNFIVTLKQAVQKEVKFLDRLKNLQLEYLLHIND